MFIISLLEYYPFESFFFLTTAAALVQSLNFSQNLPQSQSCVFICFILECRVSLWELFEIFHPIATWFVIKNLKHKQFVIHSLDPKSNNLLCKTKEIMLAEPDPLRITLLYDDSSRLPCYVFYMVYMMIGAFNVATD